jgi:hypothetical protein
MATVLASSTDKDPERLIEIPIANHVGESRHVVMSLGPGSPPYSGLPDLIPGDELEISAELELTTDAPDPRWQVRNAYRYDPKVRARLLLASDADATEPERGRARPITDVRKVTCRNTQHHTRLVYEPFSYTVPELSWDGEIHLSLVLDVHHPGAREGEILMAGQNEEATDDKPAFAKGDEGKLNVVRYRGTPKPDGEVAVTRRRQVKEVPIVKGQPVVVYTLPLPDLERDEQLLLRASLPVSNPHDYPARVSTAVFITDSPSGIDLHSAGRDLCAFHGEIGKSNGTNCLPRKSYTTEKFGTLRMLRRARSLLHANVVVFTGDPDHRSQPGDAISVDGGGFIQIARLPAGATG